MQTRAMFTVLIVCLASAFGCQKKEPKAQTEVPAQTAAQATAAQEEAKEEPAKQEEPAAAAAADVDPAQLQALSPTKATETAPDNYKIKFETTAGDFTVDVDRSWAPNGADRLYNLVKIGYFEDIAIFRVIDGFMAQFGIHGNPKVAAMWRDADIPDDPKKEGVSNKPGYLTFATRGPNTRTTQLFINYGDNSRLDQQGFTPVGVVSGDGMNVVNKFYKGYGEGAPMGKGPSQGKIQGVGNPYLKAEFPELTYIKKASIVE